MRAKKLNRRRRKFYTIIPDLNIDPRIKSLKFKRKHGFFVDKDEDIFIKDTPSFSEMFEEYMFNEEKYKNNNHGEL